MLICETGFDAFVKNDVGSVQKRRLEQPHTHGNTLQ